MLTFLGRGSAFTDEHNSAFFVENDELVLIDCAMSSFEKLNDMNMTLFKHIYVLVTHTHGDHVSGLGMLIDLMEFSVKTPITVVAPSKEVEADIRYLLRNIEGCADSWYQLRYPHIPYGTARRKVLRLFSDGRRKQSRLHR